MARYSYYVNSATGTDVPSGGTVGSPWQTINYALTQLPAAVMDDHIELYLTGSWNYSSSSISPPALSGVNLHWIANGSAELVLDSTTTRNLFSSSPGYFVFRGIRFSDVWWNQINPGSYSRFDDCRVVGRTGTTSYSITGSNITIDRCVFEGTGVAGANGMLIHGCRFLTRTGSTQVYGVYMSHGCSVVGCRFAGISQAIAGGNVYGVIVSHNSIYGAATGVSLSRGYSTAIVGNLFSGCVQVLSVSVSCGTFRENASYGHTTITADAAKVTRYETPAVLTTAPFADPVNDNWTPSAEAAALKYNNRVYGAWSSVSGGGGPRFSSGGRMFRGVR